MKNSANSMGLGLVVALLCGLVGTARAETTLFNLENPQSGSYHSGVAVLSGWACEADSVWIELAGTATSEVVEANYGTPRGDTAIPTVCGTGNDDTGFGALTNLNRLGTGPATATLVIDGEPVATQAFTVTRPTDSNFVPGLSGEYLLPNFPSSGQAVNAVWETSLQRFAIAPFEIPETASDGSTGCASNFSTKCNLENPGNGQFMSGIVVFSGWACEASEIRLELEGQSGVTETIIASYGTERGDTANDSVCGANDSRNGFGALSNVNRLGTGEASAELWIDGQLAVTTTFQVTRPSSSNFNTAISGEYRIPGFPDADSDTTLFWQTSEQNFAIKEVIRPTQGPTPTPAPGSTPNPGETPAPTSGGEATPTPDGSATPTPNPSNCGNGIIDEGEQCDGTNFGEYTNCADVYWGGLGGPDWEDDGVDCASGSLQCTSSCQIDGTSCSCKCLDDSDCYLPEGYFYDCYNSYCPVERGYCTEEDSEDCSCIIGDHDEANYEGACLYSNFDRDIYGTCMTSPFDPGEGGEDLVELCEGFDGGDGFFPRCDWCEV